MEMKVRSIINNFDKEDIIDYDNLNLDEKIELETKIKSSICQCLRLSIKKIVIHKD